MNTRELLSQAMGQVAEMERVLKAARAIVSENQQAIEYAKINVAHSDLIPEKNQSTQFKADVVLSKTIIALVEALEVN